VLSEGFWRSRFAGAPDITGKAISLGGENYTIVGVMPDDFDYPLAAEVWVPLTLSPAEKAERVAHNSLVVGLAKKGVSGEQAQAEMQAIAQTLARQYTKTNDGWSATVSPLRQMSAGATNQFLKVLFVAAIFLLLLAGTNVANIQLARATNHRKTIAIEAALGASKFRLARSLCAESVLLGLTGGAVGLIAAAWINDIYFGSIPAMVFHIVPGLRHLRIDSTVVVFTVAVSFLTGILCSLPAIGHLLGRRSSPMLSETLGQGSRSIAGDTRNRMRNVLVICEVALALLLLVSAGVMVNTFQHMLTLNLGFNPSNLLTAQISLPKQVSGGLDAAIFFDRLLPELSAIPGVKSASADADTGQAVDFLIKERAQPDASEPKPETWVVGEMFFETMQLSILRGRGITGQDVADSPRVIVVSRSIAEHYWPGGDPIGQQIRYGSSPWLTIVGVRGDITDWFTNRPQPAVYTAYRQYSVPNMRRSARPENLRLRRAR